MNDIDNIVDQILWLNNNGFKIGEVVTVYPTDRNGFPFPCDYYILGYSISDIGFRIELYIVKKQRNISSEFCASFGMINKNIFLKGR